MWHGWDVLSVADLLMSVSCDDVSLDDVAYQGQKVEGTLDYVGETSRCGTHGLLSGSKYELKTNATAFVVQGQIKMGLWRVADADAP